MIHDTAVQLPEGGWKYAMRSRRGGVPIGYCADHDPHPTEEEARRCYRKYQRDHIKLGGRCNWTSCEVLVDGKRCPNPANHTAQFGAWDLAVLCEDHNTIDWAIKALRFDGDVAGDLWHS